MVLAAALAATISGCSGSGGSGDAASAACGSPGVTTDTVKLGFLYSDSGLGSGALSAARAGLDARLGLANEAGGVHGRQLTYAWRDDGSSPSENAQASRDLIQQEGVFGLVTASGAMDNSLESLSKDRVPVTGIFQTGKSQYDNLFSFLGRASPEITADYIRGQNGRKTVFLMSGSQPFTQQVIGQYRSAFEGRSLPTVPEIITYSAGTDSPARIAQRLESSGADSIVAFTTPNDLAEIMQAVRNANIALTSTVSVTGYDSNVLRNFGRALASVSFSVNFRPFEAGGPAIDRYRDAMSRFAPQTVVPEQQFAVYGYVFADIFIRGLELAGDCPTREGVIAALHKVSDYNADGLVQPINLADRDPKMACNAFVQISQDGTAFQLRNERLCINGT
ncbi:ABC transporter substrate-binding protein [Frankia sp. Cpl3]|nr:ABC transporter substrate-binding protein [Frankia sp. Cpl3]